MEPFGNLSDIHKEDSLANQNIQMGAPDSMGGGNAQAAGLAQNMNDAFAGAGLDTLDEPVSETIVGKHI